MPSVAVTDFDYPNLDLETALFAEHGWQMVSATDPCRSPEAVIERAREADAILGFGAPFVGEVFRALPRLAIVSVPGIGVDAIDLAAAREAGVWIANVPDGNVTEVACHAMAMILSLIRGLPAYDRSVRAGQWDYAAAGVLKRPSTLSLGLLGCGRIARLVAGQGTNVFRDVRAYDPLVPAEAWPKEIARVNNIQALFADCDVVSVHVPLTPETRGLVDGETLGAMRPGSFLVNVARGPVVDTAAVIEALDRGILAGAALDVLPQEPPPKDDPALADPRILLSPHAAFYSAEADEELRRRAVYNIIDLFRHGRPNDVVVEGRRPAP